MKTPREPTHSSDDPLDWPVRGLSARSRRVAYAFAEAILSDEDEMGALIPANPALCDHAVNAFDHAVGRSSTDLRRGFAVLTLLIDTLPIAVIGTLRRMTQLPLEQRVRYLEALEASKNGLLSMLFVAFKVPLCIPAFEHPEELQQTGFDRPTTASRRKLPVKQ